MSVMITVDDVRDKIRECTELITDPERDNKHYPPVMSPLARNLFWGINIYTLPESAFEGLETDQGEPANILMVSGSRHIALLKVWDRLKSGDTKLVDVLSKDDYQDYSWMLNTDVDMPLSTAVPPPKPKPELYRQFCMPEPIKPSPFQHLKHLVRLPELTKFYIHKHRFAISRVSLTLLALIEKKIQEEQI